MSTTIRILEKENNKRGDLFGRLMSDLFLALGYEDFHLNIHKTGREVDIEAIHRLEKRRVVAECKATETSIGGDAINKFVGVLDAEKRKSKATIGYFISLSGFKDTALQQEKDAGGKRVLLLNSMQVIEELSKGRIIVTLKKAIELAGRCAARQSNNLVLEDNCELLAQEMGWIWAIYFARNKQRTHFALIHADGEALAPTLAKRIIEADKLVGGYLHSLTYLAPLEETISVDLVKEAKEKYFTYLSKECGEISLGGLPADQEVGSRRLSLEHIFVPLYLQPSKNEQTPSSENSMTHEKSHYSKDRKLVGEVFSKYARLAILADPGGGKTTLLKRIAIAYAFPQRRKSVDDKLPDRKWLPLFIRCRQLSSLEKSSINDILSSIPNLAEMKDLAEPFSLLVSCALRDGEVLLLIDGLDEISDEGERVRFITQLRIFLSIYPTVGIIITSREARFRVVGGALSAYCQHYRIADFDDSDIKRLTLAWHREVIGDQEKIRLEAEKLAATICETERVRTLARNPLLLTTLLLVKRWVGQLPSRRSILYGKAIEVLLMTWNVEGYKPIEQDEAIPQLAFIAFTMMKEGVQRISSRRLKELLLLSRKQMPDVLGYARISVSEFVKQIELRSSILIFSGHTVEQGTLYPMYEFRHLTFQEYLTARAIVDGYYPDRKDGDTVLSILEPYIEEFNWKEVVPLAAILVGRKAQPLIECLVEKCKKNPYPSEKFSASNLLAQCFLDEAQVSPDFLEKGLEWIARRYRGRGETNSYVRDLYNGKYGDVLLKVVQNAYMRSNIDMTQLGGSLAEITLEQIERSNGSAPEKIEKIICLLKNDSLVQQAAGALAAMEMAYRSGFHNRNTPDENEIPKLGNAIIPLLYSQILQLQLAASWAFAWLGERGFWSPKNNPDVLPRLLSIWRESNHPDIKYMASWAIADLPIIERESNPFPKPDQELIKSVKKWATEKEEVAHTEGSSVEKSTRKRAKKRATIILGFYLKEPWTDDELATLLAKVLRKDHLWSNGTRILKELEKSSSTLKEEMSLEGLNLKR